MQKNGIKNFVCSFILSIFAVILADKTFFQSPQSKNLANSSKNLDVQSVSLFAEDKAEVTELSNISPTPFEKVDYSSIETLAVEKPKPQKIAKAPVPRQKPWKIKPDTTYGLDKAHAIVLDEEIVSRKPFDGQKVVYEPEISGETILPIEETTEVVHQNVERADFAALAKSVILDGAVYDGGVAYGKTSRDIVDENLKELAQDKPENPWTMARGNKYAKNKMAVEAFEKLKPAPKEETAPKEELKAPEPAVEVAPELPAADVASVEETFRPKLLQTPDEASKLAYKMIQNLLIPIPDEILNDADLTPQLSFEPNAPENKEKAEKTEEKPQVQDEPLDETDKKSGLFKRITSWFSEKKADEKSGGEENVTEENLAETATPSNPKANKPKKSATPPPIDKPATILPAELRLSFQPNRAEISGQTLKWIRGFADNARDNDNVIIEIRIDASAPQALQKKRLNLLSSILAERGVDFRKINVVFTAREPNSFVIRNIRFGDEEEENTLEGVQLPIKESYY